MQREGDDGAAAGADDVVVPVQGELPLDVPGTVAARRADVDGLQASFRDFADTAARKLPLYRHLSGRLARDPEAAARLLLAPVEQRNPTLLLAAVHDRLLGGHAHELGAWYGSLTDPVRPIGDGEDDPWTHFRELLLHDPDVARDLRTRSTQTNEVGRCAALLPALAQVAATAPGATVDGQRPLGLVDVGASAGLNLLLDRYGYRYEPGGDEVGTGSPLLLTCELRGGGRVPLPTGPLSIASRVGLDRHPVDLSDRRQARWLVACQWPDQPERVHRARTAIALAHGDTPEVVTGDAVDDVAALVEAVGGFALPVVTATWALAYLPEDRQRAFVAELDRVGTTRDLTLVFAEQPDWVPGLPVPPRPDGALDGPATVLVRLDWRDGTRTDTRLADLHPHATWMEWLAP